jgi:arabinofuranosyltransferase
VLTRAALATLAVLLVVALARAAELAWVCDDAFISFRYAANLVAGHGLVYNVGERVEGYTNLLWTLLLAAGMAGGADPIRLSQILGSVCYAALGLLLAHAAWCRHRESGAAFVPLASAWVLVADDFHQWATGGLETSLFTLLVAGGALLARPSRLSPPRALAAGCVFSLLLLTRPDGLLFALAAAGSAGLSAVGATRAERTRTALALLAPVAATAAALAIWKLAYYGELLPTAFHSKSVLRPYPSQGLVYLGLYLQKNWSLPVAIGVALAARGLGWRRGRPLSGEDRDALFFAASALLFLAYLVMIGGDFMFARRILPAVPLLLLALEGQLAQVRDARGQAGLAVVGLASAALTLPVYDATHPTIRGVADERRFYPERIITLRRTQARAVSAALAGSDVRVVLEGGMCSFGYYCSLPYLVEMTGLTQYSLAKLPLAARGWVGHEKHASEAWLAEHGIHLVISHRLPPIERPAENPPWDRLYFGNAAVARIVRYDDAVMDPLRALPGIAFVPIEELVERRRRQMQHVTAETAERLYAQLDRYYFRGAGERGQAWARELAGIVAARREEESR